MAREYAENIIVSLKSLKKIQRAEDSMFDYITGDLDDGQLGSDLSAVSTILSVFLLSTPAGAVSCCAGLLGGLLSSSDKKTVIKLIEDGHRDIREKIYFLEDNPRYDKIEVKFPFIEYSTPKGDIRFITGKGVYVRCHVKNGGGWDVV
ncbi:hypothetical protein FDF26_17260 [Clostridium botulinum]|uniref:hypothetical protein n=1 Tax=Clostridium TaxID=1485 RepID=UPI00050610D6|nr:MULTISPECIES: hypothetical protein [Clostridium]KFX54737.1 hypothetical protein KU40_13320 [Clostridium botulinum]MBN1072723.1 hypothetical protein [Clostridium botulinum]MBY6780792.1 hypothetical protein [Clostridium botulinum]MBY6853974.1 hypothetical protein [Clostridium botulinum]NFR88305.1 hypothetical protein [Clostridium botulinum]